MGKKIKITVELTDVTNKMYLRSELATGETEDGRPLEVCAVVPDGSLHFKIGDKSYLLPMRDVLGKLLEALG